MELQIIVKNRQFATSSELSGVFELRGGAYMQHRGSGQTPVFSTEQQFRRYVQRMLRGET